MELLHDGDLHAIIKMLPAFGRHGALVCAYTELFGLSPLKTRAKKWRLLLEEMKRLFDAEQFTYDRRTYRISQAGIVEALSLVTHRHWTDHLENHNYLKKCMISIADREEKDGGRQAEKELRKKEAGLMAGSRYPTAEERLEADPAMKSVPDAPEYLTEAQITENKKQIKNLLKRLGGAT